MSGPGVRQKGLDNMKQISTGAGLLGLGVCMVATAFIATHRGSGEAFAQGTGGERRIVSTSVFPFSSAGYMGVGGQFLVSQRTWSDNAIDVRVLGQLDVWKNGDQLRDRWWTKNGYTDSSDSNCPWRTLDNGTSGFRPLTDVDMSGETDAGDISQVLLDFNTRSNDLPPPPIDCTVNAPR